MPTQRPSQTRTRNGWYVRPRLARKHSFNREPGRVMEQDFEKKKERKKEKTANPDTKFH